MNAAVGPPSSAGDAPAPRGRILGLIALFFALMLPNLDNSHPYQGDETYYTISALNMIERGDYLAPFYAGELRFNKPILTYWVAAAAYQLFGVAMWSARVPILLLACLTLLATWRFARHALRDEGKALLAAAMLAASPMFFGFSRVAMTEMVLLSCVVPAAYRFALVFDDPARARRHAAAGAALSGLAFMAKGPVGLLPYLAALIHGALPGRPDRRRAVGALLHPLNLAIVAAIATPWYAYVATAHPGAFANDLGTESHTLWRHTAIGVPRRLLLYLYALAVFVFPFAIAAVARAVRGRVRWNPAWSFPATVALTHLAAFTLLVGVSKSRYLLPAIPPLCIVLADALTATAGGGRRWLRAALALLVLQALYFALSPAVAGEPLRDLTRLWRDRHGATGTLGVALDEKRAGWCRLYAGGLGIAPPESADFLIVEDRDRPGSAGWNVVATATRYSSLKLERGRPTLTRQAFHLLRRERGGP